MDELDQRLITILRHNARRSISEIADELKVSRATVRSRMEKLEQRGDIVGYTVVLRSDVVSMPVRGITLIEVEGRMSDQVVEALRQLSLPSGGDADPNASTICQLHGQHFAAYHIPLIRLTGKLAQCQTAIKVYNR